MPIEVDPTTFADDREHVIVSGPDETRNTAALTAAAKRFMAVTELGTEFTPEDFDRPDSGDIYTPNYVSEPEPMIEGIGVYLDCKAMIPEEMRDRLVLVLVEELQRAGIDDAKVRSPEPEDLE